MGTLPPRGHFFFDGLRRRRTALYAPRPVFNMDPLIP
jgi:hypothetical protein